MRRLFYTGNIGGRVEGEVKYGEAAHDNAVDSLRRLAAKVQATYVIASPPLRWFLSVRGYDLVKAGSGLFGLSGSLTSNDGSRAVHRNSNSGRLEALPRPYRRPTARYPSGLGNQRWDNLKRENSAPFPYRSSPKPTIPACPARSSPEDTSAWLAAAAHRERIRSGTA